MRRRETSLHAAAALMLSAALAAVFVFAARTPLSQVCDVSIHTQY